MSLPGWRTSANQRRRIREAAEARMRPTTPPRQEGRRVRPRDEDDDQHVRDTRRFRWWQGNQENQLQELVNELTTSNDALGYWYTMSTNRNLDPHDPIRSGLEEETYEDNVLVDRVRYQDLSNQLRTHWRHLLDTNLLRGMQNAYTNEYGIPDYIDGQRNPYLAYPNIPGLNLHRVDRLQFPEYFHGPIFIGQGTGIRTTRQDGVRPIREYNSQDSQVVLTRRRGTRRDPGVTRRQPIREYLGAHQVDNPEYNIYNPEYQTSQENIEPDDFINF